MPPVVDPAEPPIKKRKNTRVFDIAGQLSKSSVLNPVVVINEIDVKIACLKEFGLKVYFP